ncbi:hypothetical protein HPP92_020473 [Vanilla planifolia]|uniref:Uncharacterized protein n=1 Tax=Vanilla planifolia TaxID=51239 RepID=A0A835Q2E7_VANPL|nr:hypothetical protein HPP92_020473 [Vanilla planifolia]
MGVFLEGFSVPQSFPGASTYDAAVVDSSLKPLPLNYSKDRTHGETSNPSAVIVAQELVTSNIEPVVSAPQLLSNSTGAFVQGNMVDSHSVETCKTTTDVTDVVSNPHVLFKPDGNSPHLITPSEILSHITVPTEIQFSDQTSGSKDLEAQKTAEKNVLEHVDVDKLIIESSSSVLYNSDTQPYVAQEEKGNVPHTTETVNFVAKDVFKTEDRDEQETHPQENSVFGMSELPSGEGKEVHDTLKAVPLKDACAGIGSDSPSDINIMKREVNQSPLGGSRSPASSPFTLHSSNESDTTLGTVDVLSQLQYMREMLNQLAINQREMQKQMEVVSVSLAKEKERLEVALGQSLEKAIKSNIDLFVAQVEAQNAKQEIIEKEKENENMLELTNRITNCMNRDFPAVVER